jgi:hypothetical protein
MLAVQRARRVGRDAGAYLRSFASGDPAVMRAFIESSIVRSARSTEERVQQYEELFADMGPLTLLGMRVAPDSTYALEVRSAKNGDLTMLMAFAPGAEVRIAGIQFRVER